MKIELSDAQTQVLKSMNEYWEELAARDLNKANAASEMNQLMSVLNPLQVLLICGEYAKNYKSDPIPK